MYTLSIIQLGFGIITVWNDYQGALIALGWGSFKCCQFSLNTVCTHNLIIEFLLVRSKTIILPLKSCQLITCCQFPVILVLTFT